MATRTLMLGLLSRVASKSQRKASESLAATKWIFRPVSDTTFQSLPSLHFVCKRCKSTRGVYDDLDDWDDSFHDGESPDNNANWREFADLASESKDSRPPSKQLRQRRSENLTSDYDADFESDWAYQTENPSRANDRFSRRFDTRRQRSQRRSHFDRDDSFPERDFGFRRTKDYLAHRDDRDGTYELSDLFENLRKKERNFSDQLPIKKNLYTEHENVRERPQEEIDEFLKKNQITIIGKDQKRPIFKFEESGIPQKICQYLRKRQFTEPSIIQSVGMPQVLSGNNVVGIAQTGSGKTLSFVLPAILHINAQKAEGNSQGGPLALVLCPTRELAMQCQKVVHELRPVCNIRSTAIFGGTSKNFQAEKLRDPDLDMVVATPGRLLDFLNSGDLNVAQCSYVVLDEADRMLDMGFEPQIRNIIQQIRPDCQVLMWSATWPDEIQDLAMDFLKDYVHIQIGAHGQMVNPDVTHQFETCIKTDKMNLLMDHLTNNPSTDDPRKPAKTLVFSATKSGCSHIEFRLRKAGLRVGSLHGDKSQRQRDEVMFKFRTGQYPVIIASDVAARGLDVSDIEFVINYDLPTTIDNYIHRVGRTARAGKKGTAISYITKDDIAMVGKLIKLLKDAGHEIPEILDRVEKARLRSHGKRSGSRRY